MEFPEDYCSYDDNDDDDDDDGKYGDGEAWKCKGERHSSEVRKEKAKKAGLQDHASLPRLVGFPTLLGASHATFTARDAKLCVGIESRSGAPDEWKHEARRMLRRKRCVELQAIPTGLLPRFVASAVLQGLDM